MNSFGRILAAIVFGVLVSSSQAAESKRPNIILMMADDMGYSDLGCYGSEIRTPNLDRLAAEGMRFTQFYNTGRCCPTRAALLTGLYSHQAGIGGMVGDSGLPGYRGFLNDHCVTIAEVLRPAGYHTLMAGKWHVGEQRPHWPLDRGFEHYFGLISGASNYFRLETGRMMALDDQPWTPPASGFYMTDAFTDDALKSIEKYGRQEQPFFLYLAYTAPHWPLHALPEDIARYKGKYMDGWDALRQKRYQRMIELGLIKPEWKLAPPDPRAPSWDSLPEDRKQFFDLKMAVYAAQIDREDQDIGRILDKLKEMGIENNTLVMFLADNGGCAEEVNRGKRDVPPGGADSFCSYGLAWAHASNTPFRLYKHWEHQGGISTPLIARWPAVIQKGGQLNSSIGHLIDLMATCTDVAGATYPTEYKGQPITPLEGKSLAPIFRTGSREGHDAIYWEHEGNRAVRQGKWKLVAEHGKDWELYDLDADRTELNNLASSQPQRVADMSKLWDTWAKRVAAAPFDKPDGQPRRNARAGKGNRGEKK